ncbi:MAG TPA: hypothetical protein PKW28_06510, partial [Turneriella sp.]|nr:hypothetical protein [Turneriella sp.]
MTRLAAWWDRYLNSGSHHFETATELKGVLGGDDLREEAKRLAVEEGLDDMEELFRSMAKRGRQANL